MMKFSPSKGKIETEDNLERKKFDAFIMKANERFQCKKLHLYFFRLSYIYDQFEQI